MNNKKHLNKTTYKLWGILLILCYNCSKPIPVNEMGLAKHEIDTAASVRAEEYAPNEYESAKRALFESHDNMGKGDMQKAFTKSMEARELAIEAFNISAPKLVAETRKEAKKAIKEAESTFAEEFAQETFKNSRDFLAKGDKSKEQNEYMEAYNQLKTSKKLAEKAKEISERQIEEMNSELNEIESIILQAKAYKVEGGEVPGKIKEAEDAYIAVKEKLDKLELKNINQEIANARQKAKGALQLALGYHATKNYKEAKEEVRSADESITSLKSDIKKNKGLSKAIANDNESQYLLKAAQDSLVVAKESLTEAKKTLDNKEYDSSIIHSEEAKRLAQIAKNQLPEIMQIIKEKFKDHLKVTSATDTSLPEGWKRYKVRNIPNKRDCLWRIAGYKFIYGDPTIWRKIYKANKSKIPNANLIYPGQVFDIPPKNDPLPNNKKKKTKSKRSNTIE